MKFIYTTAIDKIINCKARKKVIQGGTGAGKTIAVLAILIDMAASNPGLEISVVSESMPHLRRGALRDFLKILKVTNRYIDDNFNRTNLIYTFTNSSYVEFFAADNASKLRGARRDVLYLNECNNVDFTAYSELASRTRKEIFIDFNPTGRFYAHTEVLTEPDAELIILTYLDNEGIDEEILKDLMHKKVKALNSPYWANWWRVYGEGQIGQLEGVIYSNWQEIENVPEGAKLIALGLDFGFVQDPTAAVAIYKYNSKILLDEVIYKKGLTNAQIASAIRDEGFYKDIIWADSSEPKSIFDLNLHGLKVAPVSKGADSVNYGISLLQGFDLLITKRSSNLKNELDNYIWMKDSNGNSIQKPIDSFNHLLDAARYVAMMMLQGKQDFTSSRPKIRIVRSGQFKRR